MKKIYFFLIVTAIAVSVNAQIKVNSEGKVSMLTNETPLSPLSIGGAGDSCYKVSITSNNPTLLLSFQGTPTGQYGWFKQLAIEHELNSEKMVCGLHAMTYNPTPLNKGRAYGILGDGGNATNGYNYGVYGNLRGVNNGSGIVGSVNNECLYIDGRYAGYFYGAVKVTGGIYGSLYSPSATSNTRSTSSILLSEIDGTSNTTVTEKLSGLSAMQFNMRNQEAIDANSRSSSDTTTVSTQKTTELTEAKVERIHYGLDAVALQEVYPDLVYENDKGELFVNYIEMIPLLVQSIKELQAQITVLQGGGEVYEVGARRMITDIEEEVVVKASVSQNTPNPFSESTTIQYALPNDVVTALLCVYDLNGKQLIQKKLTDRGYASVTLHGGELPAGMYLYSLIADGKVIDTKRMILTE